MKLFQRIFVLMLSVIMPALLIINPLYALTEVEGEVSGEWTADGNPYILLDEVTVPHGDELTIEAGVVVAGFEGTMLVVRGKLEADGTVEDSIFFLTGQEEGEWGGIRFINADRGTKLEYCSISGGRAFEEGHEDNPEGRSGGNMLISGGEVSIHHSRIFNGAAGNLGGGIAVLNSDPVISNCDIIDNHAGELGGGIALMEGADAEIINCRIIANTTEEAGGGILSAGGSDPLVQNCHFEDNFARFGGGFAAWYGSSPFIKSCRFVKNRAAFAGGVFFSGGEGNSEPLIEWCEFVENNVVDDIGGEHGWGGGMILDEGVTAEVRYNRFIRNKSNIGGGIAIWGRPNSGIHHNYFYENISRAGGALAIGGRENVLEIYHCTFLNNHGEPEEANVAFTGGGEGASHIYFNSCIIWGATPHFWNSELVEVAYSHIAGGWEGTGNTDANPGLLYADLNWGLLTEGSGCINSGDPDLDENPDDTRNDRGWMYFPQNAMEGLASDTLHVRASLNERQEAAVEFSNQTEAVMLVSPLESWREGARLQIVNVSSITGDDEIHGVTYYDDTFYLTGGNSGDDPNYIYLLNDEFELFDSFEQPQGEDGEGFTGMTADNDGYLYAVDEPYIIEFGRSGEYMGATADPAEMESYNAIAVDSKFTDEYFDAYVGGDEGKIAVLDESMSLEYYIEIGKQIKGLGCKKNDRLLYAIIADENMPGTLLTIDPATSKATLLFPLTPPGDGYKAGGIDITQDWRDGKGTIVGIWESDGEDRLYVFDLYTTWLSVKPEWHIMLPGDSMAWDVTFSSEEIEAGDYWSEFFMSVNGNGDDGEVYAHLTVNPYSVDLEITPLPFDVRISALYPNPFNSTARIEYQLPSAMPVRLDLFDLNGRRLINMEQGLKQAGMHSSRIDATILPAGQYFLKLKTPQQEAVKSLVLVK
ncbi:right-handed parallel beta-helix repeat-containing protein [Calditrichota bacterium]